LEKDEFSIVCEIKSESIVTMSCSLIFLRVAILRRGGNLETLWFIILLLLFVYYAQTHQIQIQQFSEATVLRFRYTVPFSLRTSATQIRQIYICMHVYMHIYINMYVYRVLWDMKESSGGHAR